MKTATKEKPILFSGPMVRAILEGRKTQTRRIIKPQPPISNGTDASWPDAKADLWRNAKQYARDCCPYGQPGDRLWVRETWMPFDRDHWIGDVKAAYAASTTPDGEEIRQEYIRLGRPYQWRPSIHMPRWASRISLEITDVRVQRLQEITEEDAIAEGVTVMPLQSRDDPSAWYESSPGKNQCRSAIGSYGSLWDDINGNGSWSANPWVWAISFKRVDL